MIAGKPGAFKTALALNIATHWADAGIRSQYFSADGDEASTLKRISGIATGEDLKVVEARLGWNQAYYSKALYDRYAKKLEFEYAKMPWRNLVEHVRAYEQAYGGYPEAIFIDNLINFASGAYAFEEMQEIISDCDSLAKMTQAHVCILHHARLVSPDKGMDVEPGLAPPDDQIQGRMTQTPTLVLTLGAIGTTVNMAAVKNRNGPQFADASKQHQFLVNSAMQVIER